MKILRKQAYGTNLLVLIKKECIQAALTIHASSRISFVSHHNP